MISHGQAIGYSGLIPASQVAADLGIEEKRLRGYCLRNKVGDPIGGLIDGELYVYDWSLADLRRERAS